MYNVVSAINRTIPITQFNRGAAGKIFEDVKKTGTKVVMKNNAAECILISPEDYMKLMDELNDAKLLALALERMSDFDPAKTIPQEEVDKMFGFDSEYDDEDEVEIG